MLRSAAMMPSTVHATVLRPFLLFALLPLLAAGCGGQTGKGTGGHTYTLRAQVQQLPSQQDGGLLLEHEAIDNYVARSGKVEGMDAMTMPFPVAKNVSLEGIQPKDFVEVQLHIDWEANVVEITAIRELPPDTKLDFRAANPKP